MKSKKHITKDGYEIIVNKDGTREAPHFWAFLSDLHEEEKK